MGAEKLQGEPEVRSTGFSLERRQLEGCTPNEPLEVALLLEGAAGVESPRHFQHFYDAGVRIVSLTWNEGSQYAGGASTFSSALP